MTGTFIPAALACVVYLAVLLVPGALVALAAGQRGWVVACAAGPVTYGIIGIAGPLVPLSGLTWSPLTMIVVTAIATGVAYAVRRFIRWGTEPEPTGPLWPLSRHVVLVAAIVTTTVVGIIATYRGSVGFTAIPQWWDASFHANAVRFIADTGNSAPNALKALSAPLATNYYYPNGYHVLGATVYAIGHWSVPVVVNAANACQAGVFGLSLACLVKEVSGRPALAISTGVLACAFTNFPYDVLVWGPLFPFTSAVAAMPAVLALFIRLIKAPTTGRLVVASLGTVGLTAVHPSATIAVAVLAICYLVQRWFVGRRVPPADLRALGVFIVCTCVLGVFQLLGVATASGDPVDGWPPYLHASDALGRFVTNSASMPLPEWWLTGLGFVGLLAVRRIREQTWWLVGAGLFMLAYVFAAADGSPLVAKLTSPWWGDSWRLAAIATSGLVLLAGLGVTVISDFVAGRLWFRWSRAIAYGAVLVVLIGLTHGLYVGRNTQRVAVLYPDGPVVSHEDIAAMSQLTTLVPAGATVFNDPFDGSPWMLALDGVHPVFGQPAIFPQDNAGLGAERLLLLGKLNQMDSNQAVQQAIRDLHVRYVYLGGGFIAAGLHRADGLTNLDTVHGLTLVYANTQARIYRVTT